MNRRGFLKGLLTLGVSAAVATELVTLAEANEVLAPTPDLSIMRPPADIFWLESLHIIGCEDESRGVNFELWRAKGLDCPLVKFAINAYGGMLYWRANPMEEIVVPREHPLRVVGNFDGVAQAIGRTEEGPLRHEFMLKRGKEASGTIIQLRAPTRLRLTA